MEAQKGRRWDDRNRVKISNRLEDATSSALKKAPLRKGPRAKETGQPLEVGKSKETDSLLEDIQTV